MKKGNKPPDGGVKGEAGQVETSIRQVLDDLPRYPEQRFCNLSLNSWAVYAIYLLSKLGISATKETITIALFKMHPPKWSLVGFPNYPDSDRVNRALLQLRPKYRDWAYGDSQLGWTLTDKGRREAERMAQILEENGDAQTHTAQRNEARPRTRKLDQDLRDIERSRLHTLYSLGQGDEASHLDLWACFGSSGLTPPSALEEMRQGLARQAEILGKTEMVDFLRWVRTRFRRYFAR